jgi:hypothetical protein
MREIEPAVQNAAAEWLAGLAIGVIPILAHAIGWAVADTSAGGAEWTPDILFVVISNSGLSVVTTFSRALKGKISFQGARLHLLMALTVLLLFAAAMVYGLVTSGHSHNGLWMALTFLLGSLVTSLYFEMALARRPGGT